MDVDLTARVVESIDSEYAITLGLTDGPAIRIETSMELVAPGQEPLVIDPQNLDTDQPVQRALLRHSITSATVDVETGVLSIAFDGGVTLRVPPDSDFESWAVTWPDGSTIVALPGGEISQWGARQ